MGELGGDMTRSSTAFGRLSLGQTAIGCALSFSLAFLGALAFTSEAGADTGCPSAASITGNDNDNILEGDGGADASHDHEDFIDGQGGRDAIFGYTCADTLQGSGGADHIRGALGGDNVQGGFGDDDVSACSGVTGRCGEVVGGGHDDYLNGNEGTDFVDDTTDDGNDADEAHGGADGGDWVNTLDGNNADGIAGGDGSSDTCRRNSGDTTLGGCELN